MAWERDPLGDGDVVHVVFSSSSANGIANVFRLAGAWQWCFVEANERQSTNARPQVHAAAESIQV